MKELKLISMHWNLNKMFEDAPMYEYEYEDKIEQGYTRKYMSRKRHNQLFKYQKTSILFSYEYYCKPDKIIMEKHYSLFAKFLSVVLIPFSLLLEGIMNYKEIIRDSWLWNSRERGTFVCDDIRRGYTNDFQEIYDSLHEK